MPQDSQDRRSFMRLARILDLKIVNLYTHKVTKGQTHDISGIGIGFITPAPLNIDTDVELWAYVPYSNREPLRTTGKVVWTNIVASKLYRVGVSLNKINFTELSRILRVTA
jgi:hypothetical protein